MTDPESVILKGTIQKIVFKSPDNDFLVAKLLCDESNEIVTLTGNSFNLQEGEKVSVTGKWKENKKYGQQLGIEIVELLLPNTAGGIEKYIGSGLIKGIGPVTAKKIVEKFGLDSLNVLDNDPDKLLLIDGLASKKVNVIKKEWKKQKYIRDMMIFMQSYGISNNFALKIYNKYAEDSANILKSNPYLLIEDITGIGFKTADSIAEKLGIEKNSVFRIKSGILYLLNELTEAGHCYYPYDEFIEMADNLLGVGQSSIVLSLQELQLSEKITIDDKRLKIYLKNIFEDEKFVAEKLKILQGNGNVFPTGSGKKDPAGHDFRIEESIIKITGLSSIELDENQLDAVKKSITENVVVITGSPGTGKSTILKVIIKFFSELNRTVMLAAPTGRAAKRLSEATSCEAKTIHRLLKYQPKTNKFLKNEYDKLKTDIMIIDESSMIDIRLFRSLLSALDKNTKLILVGDADQLPAVGPGNVLRDIIDSNCFEVVRLEKIYRQGGQSKIIYNAHRIKDGMFPSLKNSDFKDFYFIEKTEPDNVVNAIIEMITERIPSNFKYDPLRDIQVIVPTNKGTVGSVNLNLRIQEKINKSDVQFNRGGMLFKMNDKIIQLKNNYEKEVYNGDIGFIESIDFELKEIGINFEGRIVNYDFFDTDQINLSYAISIHKSQGSEFKCVIIPILTSHFLLLQRNLLYTAITRAKELAVLVGSKKAIGIAVNRNAVESRFTGLKELLFR
jgi:exodeoxyribonuclease V alpha subunit